MSRTAHYDGVMACIAKTDTATAPLAQAHNELRELMDLMEGHVAGGHHEGPGEQAIRLTAAIRVDVDALMRRMTTVRTHLVDYLDHI